MPDQDSSPTAEAATPTTYSLTESVRRLLDDDDPRVGHANRVLRTIGIDDGRLFGIKFKVARELAELIDACAVSKQREDDANTRASEAEMMLAFVEGAG